MTSVLPLSMSTKSSSSRRQSVEEHRRGQRAHVAVGAMVLGEVDEDLRVHQVAGELGVGDAPAHLLLDLRAGGVEVHRLERLAGPHGERRLPLQDLRLERPREPAVRLAQVPVEVLDHRLGERDLAVGVEHLLRRQVVGDHEDRQVAHDLGGGRDLHDVAEHAVDLGVGLGHLAPARLDAERPRLLAQVGVLAAGHLVLVDLGRARAHVALEARVRRADRLPVGRPRRPAARARGRCRGGCRAAPRRPTLRFGWEVRPLIGVHRQRRRRRRRRSAPPAPTRPPRPLVSWVWKWTGSPTSSRSARHQHAGGLGLAQPGHVLDAEHVGAGGLELPGQVHVVGAGRTWSREGSVMSPV